MNTDLIIATVFFILGLIPAYYFYRKSIRIKEPVYSVKSVNVISDYSSVFPGLRVSYQDQAVENFTVSKVLFFNAGAATLNREDIATRNPLRIVAKSGKFLDADILAANNSSNGFVPRLDRANNYIVVDFEYLKQNDGAVVILMHTGLSSEEIEVVGDMKDVESLRRIAPRFLRTRPLSNLTSKAMEGALIAIVASVFTLLYFTWTGEIIIADAVLVAILTVMATLGTVFFGEKVRDMLRYRSGKIIPNGLEDFDSDYYAFPDRG